MDSLILTTAVRYFVPLLLLFSLFLLFNGHDGHGGAFPGALVAAVAFAIHLFVFGSRRTRRMLGPDPRLLIALGLGLMIVTGLPGLFRRREYLAAEWVHVPLAPEGLEWLGTPLLFDAGIYLTIAGAAILILVTVGEEW